MDGRGEDGLNDLPMAAFEGLGGSYFSRGGILPGCLQTLILNPVSRLLVRRAG